MGTAMATTAIKQRTEARLRVQTNGADKSTALIAGREKKKKKKGIQYHVRKGTGEGG